MRTKTCKACGEEKPIREYYKHPTSKDGRRNQCRACIAAQKKKYYDRCRNNPVVWAALQQQAREYYLKTRYGYDRA